MAVTKTALRRAVARRLGGHDVFTATGGTQSTALCTAAFKSSVNATINNDHLDGAWLLAPLSDAPRQRRVASVTVSSGTLNLEDNLGSSFAGGGIVFELHSILPGASGSDRLLSVDASVALALQHLRTRSTISLDVPSFATTYAFELPSWLDRKELVTDIREPNALGTTMISTHRSNDAWDIRSNAAGTNFLQFTAPYRVTHGTTTIEVEAMRPADTLVNGATSTVGLVAETDYVEVQEVAVVEIALYYCYAALAQSEDGALAAHYSGLMETQLARARAVPGYDQTNDIAAKAAPAPVPVPV